MKDTIPSWVNHVDVILPTIQYIIKILVGTVVSCFMALCGVIGWVGRQFSKKFTNMDQKIDDMHHIILSCDGCAKSAENYKRRATDI